jgi:hypothetical protein
MFATVSSKETVRLHQLTKELKTEADVLAHLGKPTYSFDPGHTSIEPDEDDKPGRIRTCKTLRYDNYSDTATIEVYVERHGTVQIMFSGKYVGKPDKT